MRSCFINIIICIIDVILREMWPHFIILSKNSKIQNDNVYVIIYIHVHNVTWIREFIDTLFHETRACVTLHRIEKFYLRANTYTLGITGISICLKWIIRILSYSNCFRAKAYVSSTAWSKRETPFSYLWYLRYLYMSIQLRLTICDG